MISPTKPTSGKYSQVLVSTNDGIPFTKSTLTKQATYTYRGRTYANQIYLLGTGKTLLNVHPDHEPEIFIDGVQSGLEITPGTAVGTLDIALGTIEVAGEIESVAAAAAHAIVDVADPVSSADTTASFYKYVSVYVDNIDTAPAVASLAQAGTGVSATAALTGNFGTGVGDAPLIPADALLLAVVIIQRNAGDTAFELISADNIDNSDREMAGTGFMILPNLGGVHLTDGALVVCHTGTLPRPVKMTGKYLDNSLSLISTAKQWEFTPSQNSLSEETFSASFAQTEMGSWTFTFEQLAADDKIIDAMLKRGGHFGLRVLYPNGRGYQSVATGSAPMRAAVGEMLPRNVSGSLGDEPAEYEG